MSQNRITELAQEYIGEMFSNSELAYDEFLESQRNLYRKNASHLSDCFTDTASWVEGEGVIQVDLEAEIVRQIMEGHVW